MMMHVVLPACPVSLTPCSSLCRVCVAGNHILPDEDLASFHWSLLGPEHPLASLKVQVHFFSNMGGHQLLSLL